MGFFKQAKDMYKLRSDAKKLEDELKGIHIESEEGGVTVTVNAKQELVAVKINEELSGNIPAIEKNIIEAHKRASKKAQEVGAEKMKGIMGGLQGMMGGGDGGAGGAGEQ